MPGMTPKFHASAAVEGQMGKMCRNRCGAHQCHIYLYFYLCQPSFPEGPERLHAIKEHLIQEGLLDRCVSFQVSPPADILGRGQQLVGQPEP